MKHFIDLSHTIIAGMITYPGLPAPEISDYLSREDSRSHYTDGAEFYIGKISLVANTGTYIDSPFHRFAEGEDISGLELASIADLDGAVAYAHPAAPRAISADMISSSFSGLALKGKAVLIHTGWDAHWGTEEYLSGHPFLSRDAVEFLLQAGISLVGIDSLNIDDTADGSRPAHTLFLQAKIPIVEHLCNLGSLPRQGFRFFALPAPVKGLGSFPVRAFAILEET
jgi:arylformamidase